MIGSFNKVYNHPIIVDEGQLHNLSNTIIKRFDKVEYEIHTVDGASYKLPSIDDVITYSNPDSRRIIKINIWGASVRLNLVYIGFSHYHYSICQSMMLHVY